MKKIIFSLLCVALILSSCGDNAVKVNRTINHEVGKVNDAMETISRNISDDEYELAKTNIDSLKVQVTSSVAAINALENKKAGVYKQSAVDYTNFVGKEAPEAFSKAINMFQAAKIREQADVESGKQSDTMINSGPDFDEARAVLTNLRKALRKNQEVLLEKQDKFIKANGLDK